MGTTRKALLGVCFVAPVADRAARRTGCAATAKAWGIKTGNVDTTLSGAEKASPDFAGIDRNDDVVARAPVFDMHHSVDVARRGKVTHSQATLRGDRWILDVQLRP